MESILLILMLTAFVSLAMREARTTRAQSERYRFSHQRRER